MRNLISQKGPARSITEISKGEVEKVATGKFVPIVGDTEGAAESFQRGDSLDEQFVWFVSEVSL